MLCVLRVLSVPAFPFELDPKKASWTVLFGHCSQPTRYYASFCVKSPWRLEPSPLHPLIQSFQTQVLCLENTLPDGEGSVA